MKKLSLALVFFLILSFAMSAVITVSAAGTLTTDKTNYAVGEEIKVTATGTNKDWVGLYKTDEVPGAVGNIYWYYCISDTVKSGDTVVINQLVFNGGRDGFTGDGPLPAGKYTIFLLENDGYNILQQVNIVVGDAGTSSQPQESAQTGEQSMTTDKTTYTVGEQIKVTASGINKDWVAIFKENEVPGTDISIFWFYCNSDTVKPGDTVVLNQIAFNSGRADFTSETLPAGKYKIYLFENDGYTALKTIDITVKEAGSSNTSSAATSSNITSKASSATGTNSTDKPKTGDMGLTVFIAALALLGSVAVFYGIKKRKSTKENF